MTETLTSLTSAAVLVPWAPLCRPTFRNYYGIDISIPEPAENFLEADILQAPIDFKGMKFESGRGPGPVRVRR